MPSYKQNSLPNRKAVLYLCPKSLILSAFRFFCFPGAWRNNPSSVRFLLLRLHRLMAVSFCTTLSVPFVSELRNAKKYLSSNSNLSFKCLHCHVLCDFLRGGLFCRGAYRPACSSCELQLAHHWWKSKGLFKIIHKIALKYALTKL